MGLEPISLRSQHNILPPKLLPPTPNYIYSNIFAEKVGMGLEPTHYILQTYTLPVMLPNLQVEGIEPSSSISKNDVLPIRLHLDNFVSLGLGGT
jgi:hypothetical protein